MTTKCLGRSGLSPADEAVAAARAADVTIEEVAGVRDASRIARLAEDVWPSGNGTPVDWVTALSRAGGVVLVAYRAGGPDTSDVGFGLGFLGWSDGLHLHSHQVGVRPEYRGRGVAIALKLTQRAVCLAHGIGVMRWTFDPLLAPNARFNIARLGGLATGFLPDFYGEMPDAINVGDRSDRLEVTWPLELPRPSRSCPSATSMGDASVLEADEAGWPKRSGRRPEPGSLVGIPQDYARLRERRDPRAIAWREELGEVLRVAFASGLIVVGFASGNYELGKGRTQ